MSALRNMGLGLAAFAAVNASDPIPHAMKIPVEGNREFCVRAGAGLPDVTVRVRSLASHVFRNPRTGEKMPMACGFETSLKTHGVDQAMREVLFSGDMAAITVGIMSERASSLLLPATLSCNEDGSLTVNLTHTGATLGACPSLRNEPMPDGEASRNLLHI